MTEGTNEKGKEKPTSESPTRSSTQDDWSHKKPTEAMVPIDCATLVFPRLVWAWNTIKNKIKQAQSLPSIQIPKLLSLGMLTQQSGAGPWDLEVQQVPQVVLRNLKVWELCLSFPKGCRLLTHFTPLPPGERSQLGRCYSFSPALSNHSGCNALSV